MSARQFAFRVTIYTSFVTTTSRIRLSGNHYVSQFTVETYCFTNGVFIQATTEYYIPLKSV